MPDFVDEEICKKCGCPIREELDGDSCWCGVTVILAGRNENGEDDGLDMVLDYPINLGGDPQYQAQADLLLDMGVYQCWLGNR